MYFLMLCISCVMNYCMWPFSVTEPFILFDVLNYVLYAVSFLRLAGMRACPRVACAGTSWCPWQRPDEGPAALMLQRRGGEVGPATGS